MSAGFPIQAPAGAPDTSTSQPTLGSADAVIDRLDRLRPSNEPSIDRMGVMPVTYDVVVRRATQVPTALPKPRHRFAVVVRAGITDRADIPLLMTTMVLHDRRDERALAQDAAVTPPL